MRFPDLKKKIAVLSQAAFAELGHFHSAQKITGERPGRGQSKWEKSHSAITFAESGEFDSARETMDEQEKNLVHNDECQYGDNDACYSRM